MINKDHIRDQLKIQAGTSKENKKSDQSNRDNEIREPLKRK